MQVEGLYDLIDAETEQQRMQSINQSIGNLLFLIIIAFKGQSSVFLEKLRTDLIQCLAFVEAFIDFESDQVKKKIYNINNKIKIKKYRYLKTNKKMAQKITKITFKFISD